MTFLEAMQAIERKVEKLHIRLRDATPLAPIVAQGRIGRYHGERYNHVIDALDRGDADIDWYYMEMLKMTLEYANRKERMTFSD